MKLGSKTKPYIKDPNAVLDYVLNWNGGSKPFLDTDTIQTSTWMVPTGITSVSQTNTTTTATIWLSGGTVGARYPITNRITTAGGRTADQTIYIKIQEQ